jgi:hypothetical protein
LPFPLSPSSIATLLHDFLIGFSVFRSQFFGVVLLHPFLLASQGILCLKVETVSPHSDHT